MKIILLFLCLCASVMAQQPYEILIRFNPDGTVRGAHQTKLITTTLPDGTVLNKVTNPEPIQVKDLPAGVNAALAKVSQQLADLDKAKAEAEAKAAATIAREAPTVAALDAERERQRRSGPGPKSDVLDAVMNQSAAAKKAARKQALLDEIAAKQKEAAALE